MKRLFLALNLVVSVGLFGMKAIGVGAGFRQVETYDKKTVDVPLETLKIFTPIREMLVDKEGSDEIVPLLEQSLTLENFSDIVRLANIADPSERLEFLRGLDSDRLLEIAKGSNFLDFNSPEISQVIAERLGSIKLQALLDLTDDLQTLIAESWSYNSKNWPKLIDSGFSIWAGLHSMNLGVYARSISQAKNFIAIGSGYRKVYILNKECGKWVTQSLEVEGHSKYEVVYALSVAAADDVVVVGFGGGVNQIVIWNKVGGQWVMQDPIDVGNEARVTATDNLIVAGTIDGEVIIWNKVGGQWVKQGPVDVEGAVMSVAATDNIIVAGSASGEVIIWNKVGGQWVNQDPVDVEDEVVSVAATDNVIVAGSASGEVIIWNKVGGQWVKQDPITSENNIMSVAATDSVIISGSENGEIHILNKLDDQWVEQDAFYGGSRINTVSATGNFIVAGTEYGGVYIWNKEGLRFVSLPIAYAIEKQSLSDYDKKLLSESIVIDGLSEKAVEYLESKLAVREKRDREDEGGLPLLMEDYKEWVEKRQK